MESALEFAREEVVPRLRGLLHAYAFWFALAAAAVLIAVAPDTRARVAAVIYGIGLCALFGASATYHRWHGHPRWKPILRRIDHSTIFLFIAASYTPISLLVLNDPLRVIVLASVWLGAFAGVAMSIAWIDAPRVLVALCYIAVGWVAIVAMPQLFSARGIAMPLLLLAGGLLYSLGAAAYATKRPNPWPRTFGFHEVFHSLVIAAAVVHFVAIAAVIADPVA
ncbi:MAG TPA: hemolysin III family protein [Thermoleophilaceae bacterium]|nr:hemolysin III family protein [Thermoleophilaceae bacterium]